MQYRSPAPGATSKVSIQDANLLKLEVTYCARMIVPVAGRALYSLLNGVSNFWNPANEAGGTPTRCAPFNNESDYRIPINAYYLIRMQSPYQR